jgi:uncharacterized membrane protein YfbV (UPF0208 family)
MCTQNNFMFLFFGVSCLQNTQHYIETWCDFKRLCVRLVNNELNVNNFYAVFEKSAHDTIL